jgi:uncharacterized membrane protein YphA (DoxX/SURF4 family)
MPLQRDLDYHSIRAAVVFTFLIFGYQKWFSFEAHQITPFISHSPLVFWLIPAFGVRGASFFLGTTEWLFGALIFLGFWRPELGMLGALGSTVTFSWHRDHHPVLSQRLGGRGGRLSRHVFAGRLPDEGCAFPCRFPLPLQAGSDARSARDSAELSLEIRRARGNPQ